MFLADCLVRGEGEREILKFGISLWQIDKRDVLREIERERGIEERERERERTTERQRKNHTTLWNERRLKLRK